MFYHSWNSTFKWYSFRGEGQIGYDILAILFLLILVFGLVEPKIKGDWISWWFPGIKEEWLFPFVIFFFPAFWILSALVFLTGLLFPKNRHKHPFLVFLPLLIMLRFYFGAHVINFSHKLFLCGLFSTTLVIHIVITVRNRDQIVNNQEKI